MLKFQKYSARSYTTDHRYKSYELQQLTGIFPLFLRQDQNFQCLTTKTTNSFLQEPKPLNKTLM